jgi:Transcriptional regulator containing an amidase domain and an AraC-type DNA-binding HTH domain
MSKIPVYNAANKNVFIIADAKMTVLFDMLAPFYLFNATGKANVYIVAKDKTPILIKRDLFVGPQLTFEEADSMQLLADVIVIPALSKRDEHQDTAVINWIKAHFSNSTKILAVCDGASTAAATGLYDGKPLTCHASDYEGLKVHFNKPAWVKDIAVTKSGNLFSTAGVSNAVEGSLTVINELFDRETMQKVLEDIGYPAAEIKTTHKSIAVTGSDKFTVLKKIMFRKNRTIGLLMEDGMNEFEMASIVEAYGRSFPASFTTCNLNSSAIQTKYGLTMLMTGDTAIKDFNELHVLKPGSISADNKIDFSNTTVISYDTPEKQYPIDICLKRIGEQYGRKFGNFVKISLDYN